MGGIVKHIFVPLLIYYPVVKVPIIVDGNAKCVGSICGFVAVGNDGSVTMYYTGNTRHKVWGLIVEAPASVDATSVYTSAVATRCPPEVSTVSLPRGVKIELAPPSLRIDSRKLLAEEAKLILEKLAEATLRHIYIPPEVRREAELALAGEDIYYVY